MGGLEEQEELTMKVTDAGKKFLDELDKHAASEAALALIDEIRSSPEASEETWISRVKRFEEFNIFDMLKIWSTTTYLSSPSHEEAKVIFRHLCPRVLDVLTTFKLESTNHD